MEALSRFLTETGRYEPGSVDLRMLAIQASTIANVRSDANKGVVSAEQYYMTLLLTLPINPVDYAGALNAIRGAEYNISIFPDTQDALMTLKHHHNVKLGVVTDSMSSTTEKKKWMEGAGLNTDLYARSPSVYLPIFLSHTLCLKFHLSNHLSNYFECFYGLADST